MLLRETKDGVRLQPRPLEGNIIGERATFPANPSNPVAIIVVELMEPELVVTLVEVVDNAKSWIV